MKISIAIVMAILFFMPTVYSTGTITDVRWNTNLKVIELLFDEFPAHWGDWTMYVDGEERPMEDGPGNPIVRPNAPIEKATGLFIGTGPWLSDLEDVNFPCCGAIQFSIPGQGLTNTFRYNLNKQGCKTASMKACEEAPVPMSGPEDQEQESSKALTFRVSPSEASPGSEVSLYLSQAASVGGVYFNGRALPKKTSPDGKVITVTVPGDNQIGSWYFELEHNGQMIQSQNRLEVIPTFGYSTPEAPSLGSSEVITGLVVGVAVPPVDRTPPPPDSGMKLENNVDRPGMDYRSYALSSADPQLCANDCSNDPNCKAFTYVKPGVRGTNSKPECWLKNPVPNPVAQECCISGVKAAAIPESPSVDWNNIPGLVLHLWHNVNQADPQLEPTKTNLFFFQGNDRGGSSGQGYCWWMISDNPDANAFDWSKGLPSGLVLALDHLPNFPSGSGLLGDTRPTSFGLDPIDEFLSGPTLKYGFLLPQDGGDLDPGAQDSSWKKEYWGFYWLETSNPDFSNWDEAEKKLPKGTILGLKHSMNQPEKKVSWRGQQYDPVTSYRDRTGSPPTFVARHGGDLGAPSGEGYYWFEKTTGPDFFKPRS